MDANVTILPRAMEWIGRDHLLGSRPCTLYFVAMQWTYLRSSPILISRYPLVGGSSVVLPTEWRGKSLQCGRRRRMIFITRILHTMHSEEREAIHSPTACFVLHTFHINIIPMLLFQHQIIQSQLPLSSSTLCCCWWWLIDMPVWCVMNRILWEDAEDRRHIIPTTF